MVVTKPKPTRPRAGGLGRPTSRDAISGLVTGLFSIPEGMAYASIGGFAAPLGLWSGVVPTIVGSVFARTVLMVTTLTSAIALSASSVLAAAGLRSDDPGALATLAILTGVIMLVLGLLKLGTVMAYVSAAVMTGFTTGIALQIITGVLNDATGYKSDTTNTLAKLIDTFVHVGFWDPTTVAVAVGTVLCWALVGRIKPLKSLATLIALVVVSVVTGIAQLDVELVSDIAAVPRSLPPVSLPDLGAIPHLVTGAVAVALVALAQSAGIGAAVPNPDGSRPNASRDFAAQGLANIAGGFFSALPTGGSLSRTGVGTSAGARTRWSGIFAGVSLGLIVLAVGPVAGLIPMPVIGGLLLIIGGELVWGRRRDIQLVFRTSWQSIAAMLLTFAATTTLPLQQAIFLGAGFSILLCAIEVAQRGGLAGITRDAQDGWVIGKVPKTLPSNQTTVLHYTGPGFFAEVERIEEDWPDSSEAENAAVVLSLRGAGRIPSATLIKSMENAAERLREQGIVLVLSGVDDRLHDQLVKSRAIDSFGEENVLRATPAILESLTAAYDLAERCRTGATER